MIDLYIVLFIGIALFAFHSRKSNRIAASSPRRKTIIQVLWGAAFILALMIGVRFSGGAGVMKIVIALPIAIAVFALVYFLIREFSVIRERVILLVVRILGVRNIERYGLVLLAILIVLGTTLAITSRMTIDDTANSATRSAPSTP
ncbi:MAG: hypothetical protein SGI88_07930 [Candidatus Hydrogenedentes bacterium]|nr:hypothetical protein [Candidatus Hydrogenedentota bacterium]